MRVAVVGAGTAGHMAVAHVSKFFPASSITHFHDPAAAPIGVGEGTTPAFTGWAGEVLGWDLDFLAARCDATPKSGIVFEGWGRNPQFTHFFGSAEGAACHLSAARLVEQLADVSTATVVAERVGSISLDHGRESARVGGRTFDYVFDARGFPHALGDAHVELSCVPTDAAVLVRGEPREPRDRTRAVARPHGWIFVIPLGTDTAYGYVHTHKQSADAEADFDRFLDDERVREVSSRRVLRFPNFRRRNLCDGHVFSIGNRAGFIEPLEAATLGLTVLQLRMATYRMLERTLGSSGSSSDVINEAMAGAIDEVATFVGWHYAQGSAYDTPFWRAAARRFEKWLADRSDDHQERFRAFQQRGRDQPVEVAFAGSIEAVDAVLDPRSASLDTFGGFPDASFAKVGHGLGVWPGAG